MAKIGKALNSSKLGGVIIDILEKGIVIESSNKEVIHLRFPKGVSENKKKSFELLEVGQFVHTQCKISGESVNGHHKIYMHKYVIDESKSMIYKK